MPRVEYRCNVFRSVVDYDILSTGMIIQEFGHAIELESATVQTRSQEDALVNITLDDHPDLIPTGLAKHISDGDLAIAITFVS